MGVLAVNCLNIKPLAANVVPTPHNKVIEFIICNLDINKVRNIKVEVMKNAPA